MNATILFADGSALTAEQNGDCFITAERPEFPEDMSIVIIEGEDGSRTLRGVTAQACASVDGRYWFALLEESGQARALRDLRETIEIQAGAIEELAAIIGGEG